MKILFIRSRHLQTVSAALALNKLGHEIIDYDEMGEEIDKDENHEQKFGEFLNSISVDLVLSHIFTPAMARQTYQRGIKYAVYGLDSPMYMTYVPVFPRYSNCFLFYFDYREYCRMRQNGYTNAYYLPLASDIIWTENLVITEEDITKYRCDISFVGTLYSDNTFDRYNALFPGKFQELFSTIMENCAFKWDGRDRITPFLTPELVESIKQICPEVCVNPYGMPEENFLKSLFFSRKLTNIERTLILSLLAEQYDLRFYTKEKEKAPDGVKKFPEVPWQSEAFKVFYSSKINLNITLRSIESGIPMRVYDIMSVGGFVLSNYQEEMTELFEEDKEIVLFRSPEELLEKVDYYLTHDRERIRIGINGYKKVKECYSFEQQMKNMLSVIMEDI